MEVSNTKIPISLLTGFLGSGKTTLLNHLLTTPAMANTAILVNEFGQISIDNDLIKRSDETVIELKNGCVCCSLNDDLGTTLHDFMQKRQSGDMPKFEKLVIETTGLANAGPVVQVILEDPLVRDDYCLDKVITVVDSVHGIATLNIHAESVEQAAIADRLILTKLDRLESDEERQSLEELRGRLRKLNSTAPILSADRGTLNVEELFSESPHEELTRFTDPANWMSKYPHHHHDHDHDHDHDHHHHHNHDDHIKSFCIVREEPIALDALQRFWSEISDEAGLNLLRVKGLVNVAERPDTPAVVQGVQQTFDDVEWMPVWPNDDHRTRLVFIGWDLDQEQIGTAFSKAASNGTGG